MFNRDRVPGLPGSSPRPPQQRSDGYGPPPTQRQQPPPQRSPGYDPRAAGYGEQPPAGYPQAGQQRAPQHAPQAGGGRVLQLRPIKSPGGNAYAFGNLQDHPYLLII